MDDSVYAIYGIGYVLAFLAQLVVLTACTILLIKRRNLGSILMFLGSLGYGLISVFGLVSNIFAAQSGPEALIRMQQITYVGGQLSYLLFGTGLLFLVLTYLRQTRSAPA